MLYRTKMLPGSQLLNSYTRLKSQYPFDLWFVQRLNSWQTIMFYDSQPSWFASHSSQNIICNKNRDQIAYFDGWLIHTLEQPCSTSGQLAECGQKGHFVLPNAPLPQKKSRDDTFLSCHSIWENETHFAKCALSLASLFSHFWNSSCSINLINLYPQVHQ